MCGIHLQLVPDVEQKVYGILGACRIIRVAELESVLLETEHLKSVLVEVSVEFLIRTGETALMQVTPDGRDGCDEPHVLKMVVNDESQVLVHREYRHRIQVRQHIVVHGIVLLTGEGVAVEGFYVFLVEVLHGYQQHFRVNGYTDPWWCL